MTEDEIDALRAERDLLQLKVDLFAREHRILGWLGGLVLLGPSLAKSLQSWLKQVSSKDPLPIEETAALGAAVIRRLTRAGLLALLIPSSLLIWQNLLIRTQNLYLREQIDKVQQQIRLQERQGDSSRRAALLDVIYEGKTKSLRTRAEAVKAFVELERNVVEGERIDLRGIDLSCPPKGHPSDCANLDGCLLYNVDLTGANLQGASLRSANLNRSVLTEADLRRADLSHAEMEGTLFRWPAAFLDQAAKQGITKLIPDIPTRVEASTGEMLYFFEFAAQRVALSSKHDALNSALHAAILDANTKLAPSPNTVDHMTLLPFGPILPGALLPAGVAIEEQWSRYVRANRIEVNIERLAKDLPAEGDGRKLHEIEPDPGGADIDVWESVYCSFVAGSRVHTVQLAIEEPDEELAKHCLAFVQGSLMGRSAGWIFNKPRDPDR